MKQAADNKTQDAFPKDVFELNAGDAWPFPEPLPEWLPKQEAEKEPTLRDRLSSLLSRNSK